MRLLKKLKKQKIKKYVMNQNLYKDALTSAMTELGKLDNTIFIGQQIVYAGNPMSTTLGEVPKEKMIEVPVMEESQMGMSLGLSMANEFVITFYPRWDFIICAANQLINHVDKLQLMSGGEWKANMIIRLGKGSDKPLDPGHQHKGNYFEQFKSMCSNINFVDLTKWEDIEPAYKNAYTKGGIHCLVEYPELYYIN
jgi:pyruvate/2-oxoglutarate/acetoin dehydrogenase E1 component